VTIINAGAISGGQSGDGLTRADAITFAGGTNILELQAGSTITGNVVAFSSADTLRLGGSASASFDVSQIGAAAQYRNFGVFEKTGASTWTLTGSTTAVTPWTINQGMLVVSADSNLGAASGGLTFNGGTLQFGTSFNLANTRTITLAAGGGTIDTGGFNTTIAQGIGGVGGLTKAGAGDLTLSGPGNYGGPTNINAGTLRAGAVNAFATASSFTVASGATLDLNSLNQTIGSLAGGGAVALGSATLTSGGDNTSTAFSGGIGGGGGLIKTGGGIFALTGTNTYTGATTVTGGTLIVNGTIASSSGLTVDAGATVGGTGTLPTAVINGTLAPGNSIGTLTIQGNLVLTSAAAYIVEVSPTQADRTNVTGTATLAGTVQAVFGPGSYIARTYTILSAAGGRSGTFGSLTTSGLPAGFAAALSYTGTDTILNLTAVLGQQPTTPGQQPLPNGALSINQFNVANSLNSFFNNGGTLPPGFVTIFGLTGANLGNALSQLSGEAATGAQQAGFQMGSQFLNLMLDPFVDGRSGVAGTGAAGPALGFAPEREALPDDIALAYSKVFKEPRATAPVYEPRWSAWGGAYGGGNRTSGDPAVVGSHDVSATTAGFAAGLDYRLSPNSVVGLALAGGGSNWNLAQGLGGGKSDAFQAGVYGATKYGPAYLAAAFAFANHWMSTDRFAFAGDHLTASFNAQSYGGRVESGYRFATWYGGVTPYAAIHAQSFHTPGYSETDTNGGGFGLAYNSRTGNDTRSELGTRFDRVLALYTNAVLSLRARVAWAHDWVSDPSLAAVFQTLPGASFIVNGATPAKNSALASAGTELRLANGITLLAKFDGEFASHSSTYAGTGAVRYTW
jgi:outer membrane autotransporter protein